MTHFVGLVIGPDVEGQIARYDENLDVPKYRDRVPPMPEGWEEAVARSASFQEKLAAGVDRQEAWTATWGEANNDPTLPWSREWARRQGGVDPTDDAAVAAFYAGGDEELAIDDEGLYRWSTSNPDGRWDWYEVGGRWVGLLQLLDGGTTNVAPASSIDWSKTFADYVPSIVVAEGVWRASKEWGWFGMATENDKADGWDEWIRTFVAGLGDLEVTVVDFHV